MADFDIAIIGGGPAGTATALFLCAHSPHRAERIILIDKAQFPREKICAGAIGARATRALQEIGVPLPTPRVDIEGLSVRTPNGYRRFSSGALGTIGHVVRRSEYDTALLSEVKQRGVVVKQGVKMTGLTRHVNAMCVHTSDGDVTARLVIGADGVGSRVRRWLGLGRGEFIAQAVEVDTPIHPHDTRDLHFDLSEDSLQGYAWDFPTRVDAKAMICRGVYELVHGAGRPSTEDVGSRLRRRLRVRGFDPDAFRFKRFAERGLSLKQPYGKDRVVLVGEAAGIDPVLGEGIAQAILYGRAAGPFLAEALDSDSPSLRGYGQAISRSRVGLDLAIRSRLPRLFYGHGRPIFNDYLLRSESLAWAGMHYFAGERVPRLSLARAGRDLARSTFEHLSKRIRAGGAEGRA